MIDVLSRPGQLQLLAELAQRPLLAFDFDGTLAPIVADPAAAELPPSTAALLDRLLRQQPCAIISGRSLADLVPRLGGLRPAMVVGNHGSEPFLDIAPLREYTARAHDQLTTRLAPWPGVVLENKGLSLSIHYRHSFDRRRAHTAIVRAVDELAGAQVIGGKCVVNLLPPGALDKGQALLRVMDRLGRGRAIYVGDDSTDERAFALPPPAAVLGIRVRHIRETSATLYLRQQRQIDVLLRLILSQSSEGNPQEQGAD